MTKTNKHYAIASYLFMSRHMGDLSIETLRALYREARLIGTGREPEAFAGFDRAVRYDARHTQAEYKVSKEVALTYMALCRMGSQVGSEAAYELMTDVFNRVTGKTAYVWECSGKGCRWCK